METESWPPKISMTRSPEPVSATLLGRRDFADTTDLRILRWGDGLGSFGGPVSSQGPDEREKGHSSRRSHDVSRGWVTWEPGKAGKDKGRALGASRGSSPA